MKTLIITAALVLTGLAALAQTKVTRYFPCHNEFSNTYQAKLKTIDSLKKQGYKLIGFRVDNTFSVKGYNTQVLTFIKVK